MTGTVRETPTRPLNVAAVREGILAREEELEKPCASEREAENKC